MWWNSQLPAYGLIILLQKMFEMSYFCLYASLDPANTEYSRIFAEVMSSEYLRNIFREYSTNIGTLLRISRAWCPTNICDKYPANIIWTLFWCTHNIKFRAYNLVFYCDISDDHIYILNINYLMKINVNLRSIGLLCK